MKLKLTSPRLLYIILVQIMIIDVIVIGALLNKVGFFSGKAALIATTTSTLYGQAPFKIPIENSGRLKKDVIREYLAQYRIHEEVDVQAAALSEYLSEKKSFTATAYDLSYKCCGKYPSHPEYGITFSGVKAIKGRTVAVDPNVIPMGSYVHIEFPSEYTHLDGWYIAEDTGNKVKGNIVDIFFGESAPGDMEKFGRRMVSIRVICPQDVQKLLQKGTTYITINGK